MDSCPEKVNAVMGEGKDACSAGRSQLIGEGIIGFAMNSPGLKNKSPVMLECFNQKIATPPVYFCGSLCLSRFILLSILILCSLYSGGHFEEFPPRDKTLWLKKKKKKNI